MFYCADTLALFFTSFHSLFPCRSDFVLLRLYILRKMMVFLAFAKIETGYLSQVILSHLTRFFTMYLMVVMHKND
jgi:hypothetical protein